MTRWVLLFFLGLGGACGKRALPPDPPRAQELENQLQTLEARLLWSQSRVHFWAEMAQRHKRVSEVACRNQNTHLHQMLAWAEKQNEKAYKKRRGTLKTGSHVQAKEANGKKKR